VRHLIAAPIGGVADPFGVDGQVAVGAVQKGLEDRVVRRLQAARAQGGNVVGTEEEPRVLAGPGLDFGQGHGLCDGRVGVGFGRLLGRGAGRQRGHDEKGGENGLCRSHRATPQTRLRGTHS